MLLVYKTISKFLQFVLNMLFVIQITLMILVFLTSTYWFLDLIGSNAFNFAAPLANSIIDLIRIFYHEDIEVGGVYVDGSLLLFDIIALVLVFSITKFKYYLIRAMESSDASVKNCKLKIEEEFNKQLQTSNEERIKKAKNAAILVKFAAKNSYVDNVWGGNKEEGVKEKEDEAFKIFYAAIKNISGCKFAKTGDMLLILLEDFSKIDNLLNFIYHSVNRIKLNMKKKHWKLNCYMSIDVYDNKIDFKSEIYPLMEKLVALKHPNEALCMGNFNLRYNLLDNRLFTFVSKGPYDGFENCNVYALVKKI